MAVSLSLVMGCAHVRTPDTEAFRASFGILNDAGNELTPTNRIPYQIGTSYGWMLTAFASKGKVQVKEVFKLPAGAPWIDDSPPPPDSGLKIIRQWHSKNGDLGIHEYEMDLSLCPFLTMQHHVINGDPPGKYRISLFVDDRLIKKFTFQVTNAD